MKQHYYDYEIENKYLEKILFYGCRVNISRKDGNAGVITATAVETGANGKDVLYSATGFSVGESIKKPTYRRSFRFSRKIVMQGKE